MCKKSKLNEGGKFMEVNKTKYQLEIEKLNTTKNCATNKNDQKFFENLKWLTSSETIIYLRLSSVGALRQLVYRRKIPFYKFGRRLLFNRAELDQFLESSRNQRKAA